MGNRDTCQLHVQIFVINWKMGDKQMFNRSRREYQETKV